ncbi:hypothetical protein GCM10025792_33370 [Pseudonocardia tropica]
MELWSGGTGPKLHECRTRGRGQLDDVRSPCRLQRAVQPTGSTCTAIRRAQSGQKRGGSSSRRAAHRGWSGVPSGAPHWSQYGAPASRGCARPPVAGALTASR